LKAELKSEKASKYNFVGFRSRTAGVDTGFFSRSNAVAEWRF
jgi:hypothetical protein